MDQRTFRAMEGFLELDEEVRCVGLYLKNSPIVVNIIFKYLSRLATGSRHFVALQPGNCYPCFITVGLDGKSARSSSPGATLSLTISRLRKDLHHKLNIPPWSSVARSSLVPAGKLIEKSEKLWLEVLIQTQNYYESRRLV